MPAAIEPRPEVLPSLVANGDAHSHFQRRSPATTICGSFGVFALFGVAFALWLRQVPAGNPDPRFWYNVFFFVFARNEPAGLLIIAGFSIACALFLQFGSRPAKSNNPNLPQWICPAAAAFAFAFAALGTQFIFHNWGVSADENLADFQAQIFARGKLQAQVPPTLWRAVHSIKPTFVEYFPATHSWNATYLPVYAALRACLQIFGLQSLLNPLLAAATIIALCATARNIWPEANAAVAALLLATTPQFLFMSMTAYAMPAHLALNTVWLCLYSRRIGPAFYLAPVVGVFALGLHQPVPHALFVAPFLVRMVRDRRCRAIFIYGGIYFVGCLAWQRWRAHFTSPMPGGVSSVFRLWNPRMAIVQPMNLLLIIGWASLATPLLAALGFARFRRLPPLLQDCALSCALTFGFYYFFYLDQAHGWGYRYFHGTLSCLILVAVAGYRSLAEIIGPRRAKQFLVAGAVTSVLLLLPLRAWQAESFVRPFARTAATMRALPVEIVAFDPRDAWYSADLIRNDPFFEDGPLIVSIGSLTPESVATLRQTRGVAFIDRNAFARLGMFTERRNNYAIDPFTLGMGR